MYRAHLTSSFQQNKKSEKKTEIGFSSEGFLFGNLPVIIFEPINPYYLLRLSFWLECCYKLLCVRQCVAVISEVAFG